MTSLHAAQLEGGPFDGDTGGLEYDPAHPSLPAALFCCACAPTERGRGPRCTYAGGACTGVHWWTRRSAAEEDPERQGDVEHYSFARIDRGGFDLAVYIYAELTENGHALLALDKSRVPAGALGAQPAAA